LGGLLARDRRVRGEMTVDVTTGIVIRCSTEEVAAYAANPDNAPKWYVNIKTVEWKTTPPTGVGSQIAFVAHFLGRRLAYTYEIVEFVPGKQLVMRTAEGPFLMETSYSWERTPDGHTKMTLRNRGIPSGFSAWVAPLMAWAMRRANRRDLARLKAVLENRSARHDLSRPTMPCT
jgi:Polyketide cyclase / dehydrase and lipid transport